MSASPRLYAQCGVRIRSELEVDLAPAPGDEWDVDVRWGPDIVGSADTPPGEVVASYGEEESGWYTATWTGEQYLLRFRGCGEFAIAADLSAVEVRRDRAGRHELLPILLAGTASAFLLTLRGATILHASAVSLGDATMAFVGYSGRGKTTVAALMCVAGAALVTDDVLRVVPGPPVTCLGGARELRLRPAAAPLAEAPAGATTRPTVDERLAYAPRPVAEPLAPSPLTAIVIPSPSRTTTELQVQRLEPSVALFAMLSFPRVFGWRRPEVLSRDFAVLSEVVNHVPVYDVKIPWGPPFDPAIAPALAALGAADPDGPPVRR